MRGRIRIAIVCAGLLAMSAASARAQTTYRETGSVTVGGYLVWVRGTSANVVQLFVGRGFRDAFAQAHEMDAAKLQHWIDSVRAVAPLAADDTSAVDAHVTGSPMGDGVTMIRRVGGPFSGLRLIVTGEEPITMAEPTARDFLEVLDSATHAAHALSPPTAVQTMVATTIAPATAVTPTVTTAPADPAPKMARANQPVAATVARAAVDTPHVVVVPAPVKVDEPVVAAVATGPVTVHEPTMVAAAPVAASPAQPDSVPVVAAGPSTAEASPELVLPPPQEPVILLASRVDIMPLPLPTPVLPAPAVVAPAVVAPTMVAPTVVTLPVAAVPLARTVSTPAPPVIAAAPVPAPAVVAPAPSSVVDTAVSPPAAPAAPADKLIHTPLGPFTIPGALLADRDKEAQYCYTQLGLKYSPDLKGEITVKVLVGSDGAVQEAVVTKRSWQGISAGEVEACVRALAHDWTFAPSDPSITDGGKLLTFSFAP